MSYEITLSLLRFIRIVSQYFWEIRITRKIAVWEVGSVLLVVILIDGLMNAAPHRDV